MGRLVWPLALVVTFVAGWAVAGYTAKPLPMIPHRDDEIVSSAQD